MLDNVKSEAHKFLFGTNVKELNEKLLDEKNKNKILQQNLDKCEEKLKVQREKNRKNKIKIEDLKKRVDELTKNKNSEIDFKVYYSLLGATGSSASFEIDVQGVISSYHSELKVMEYFSSEQFFEDILAVYTIPQEISDALTGTGRVTGLQLRQTTKDVDNNLKVLLDIKSAESPHRFERVLINNPFR